MKAEHGESSSSTRVRSETAIETPRARTVDIQLEVVVPVLDVDRAKRFYGDLGRRITTAREPEAFGMRAVRADSRASGATSIGIQNGTHR